MITNPNRRNELLYYLEVLSDKTKQKAIWLEHIFPESVVDDCLDYAIHFLFDDTSLGENPEAYIGHFLEDKEEAIAIALVTKALSSLIDELGDVADEVYLAHSSWHEVIEASKHALATLRREA